MARNGPFGGRTQEERATGSVDRDRDGTDDRDESRTRILSKVGDDNRDRTEDLNRDRTAPPPPPPAPVERVEPTSPGTPTAPVRVAPARASMMATLGVMLGLLGTAAALTGRLAPFGVALGVLGMLFSLGGVVAGGRPNVAGRGLGTFGALLCVAAVVFGVLAMTHTASWLNSDVDQVSRLRDWLDTKLTWMRSW